MSVLNICMATMEITIVSVKIKRTISIKLDLITRNMNLLLFSKFLLYFLSL